MKLKALLAAALLWASPAVADNFVLTDALGNNVTIACTTAAGVCTLATTASVTPPAEQDVDVIKYGNTATTLGQKAMSASIPAVLSSDQSTLPVNQIPGTGATLALAPDANTAKGSSNVLKASAGNLYQIQVTTYAVAGYVMAFNATSLPSNGAVTPLLCWVVPANSTLDVTYNLPIRFSTGITIGFSSDTDGCFDLTASTEAFIYGSAQ